MLRQGSFLHADLGLALYAQSACPASALLRAAHCCSPLRCNHRCDMGRKTMSAFAKAKKLQNRMEACLPSHLLQDVNGSNQLVGPFNNASEISHTARSSSGSDGGPLVTSEHAPPPSQQPTQWQCNGADGDASDKVEKRAAEVERKCGSHGGGDHACAPAPALATAHVHDLVANELRGPMESGVMGDASTEGDSATGGASTCARWKYTRANVRGRWLELRDRLRDDAPLPLEWPSLTIPKEALATMMVLVPCSGEDVKKRGPAKYADFAESMPPQNPFTPASAHGGTSQSNISQYNNGCSGSQISGDFSQPNSVHHYYYYPAIAPPAAAPPAATAPAAAPPTASAPAASAPAATAPATAPAAAAPPSSEAQQLANMKTMFEQGLIPSREIYEDKVRQILGLR